MELVPSLQRQVHFAINWLQRHCPKVVQQLQPHPDQETCPHQLVVAPPV